MLIDSHRLRDPGGVREVDDAPRRILRESARRPSGCAETPQRSDANRLPAPGGGSGEVDDAPMNTDDTDDTDINKKGNKKQGARLSRPLEPHLRVSVSV